MLPDDPFTIAMAARYLMSARPSLGITDPYELTASQFGAAVGVLRSVRPNVSLYYSQDAQVIDGRATRSAGLRAPLPRPLPTPAPAGSHIAAPPPPPRPPP